VSPRHAIVFTILIAILFPYYYFVDRPEIKAATLKQEQESLLRLETIDSITLQRGDEKITYKKTADGKLYALSDPANKFVPQDLMQALAGLLINAKSVEIVAENPQDLSQFGLDHPRGELTVIAADKPAPIKITFGSENPTHSAVYAQIEGIPKVFLLGKNLEYYQTLMFQWVEGKQGKNA